MGLKGPLDQPRLREIDEKLDSEQLEEAQHLLASLGDVALFRYATTYLATRLLYLRGRLTSRDVAQRLQELLRQVDYFPEARAMLAAAEGGTLRDFSNHRRARAAERSQAPRPSTIPPPEEDFDESTGAARVRAAIIQSDAPTPDLDDMVGDKKTTRERTLEVPAVPVSMQAPEETSPRQELPRIPSLEMPRPPVSQEPATVRESPAPDRTAVSIPSVSKVPAAPRVPIIHLEIPDLEVPPADDDEEAPSTEENPPADDYTGPEPGPLTEPTHSSPRISVGYSSVSSIPAQEEGFITEPPEATDTELSPPPEPPAAPDTVLDPESLPGFDPHKRLDTSGLEAMSMPPGGMPNIPRAPSLPQFDQSPGASPPPARPHADQDGSPPPGADPVARRSQLPPRAGRYSEAPVAPEMLHQRPSSVPPLDDQFDEPDPPADPQPPLRRLAETPAMPPIRSGPNAAEDAVAAPALFELAAYLDDQEYDACLTALDAHGELLSAELRVLKTQALIGAERYDEAAHELVSLEAEQHLEPEVRAKVARILLEQGEVERALAQARQALREAPHSTLGRLIVARAALALDRRQENPDLVREADATLSGLNFRAGPHSALIYALRANVQATHGDADKAISLAQRALGMNPESAEAVVALALATARLGRVRDSQQSWLKLLDLSFEEADAISERLECLGVVLEDLNPGTAPVSRDFALHWRSIELDLARDTDTALADLETHAADQLQALQSRHRNLELPLLATVTGNYLTSAPVWQCFAPWDLSLWSISRLEASLMTVFGYAKRPSTLRSDPRPLIILLGTYLGECLRQSHQGKWRGSLEEPMAARVVTRDETWEPIRMVRSRIEQGGRFGLNDALDLTLPDRNHPAWRHRIPNPVPPGVPWGKSRWPRPELAQILGQDLSRTILDRFARRVSAQGLVLQPESIRTLDRYLEFIAPGGSPQEADPPWGPRVAALVGTYVGEILVHRFDAEWVDGDGSEGPAAFVLRHPNGNVIKPVEAVWLRVTTQRRSKIAEWFERTLHDLER